MTRDGWTPRLGRAHAIGFAVLLLASRGSADVSVSAARPASASHPPLASTLKGEARAAYDRARQLYDLGDAAGAYTSFKRAYELAGDPRLLWNMAASAKSERRYARAHALVISYLHDAGSALTPDSRAAAEQTQRALRELFSDVTLRGAPNGASVSVDGEEVGRAPLTKLELDVGTHIVRVDHEDFAPFESRIEVAGPGPLAIDVTMLLKANARLVVTASAGDSIRIDGTRVALNAWDGAVAGGTHTVAVTAPGKKPYTTAVDLAPRTTRTLQVTLEPERTSPVWPWITAGAAVTAGAVVGGYFLFQRRTEPGVRPEGGLGTAELPVFGSAGRP